MRTAPGYREDRILVKPKVQTSAEALANLHAWHGNRALRTFDQIGNLQVVQLSPGANAVEMIARYQQSGLIEFAEPDYRVRASIVPNDPRFADGTLWGLNNTGQSGGVPDADIDAPEGWDTLIDAANIIVAVIDSGVRYTHEDLSANIWTNPGEIPGNGADDDRDGIVDDVHGINAINNSGQPTDDNGHGTHVAGTIGAVGNNGKGVTGVAWRVQIMACKFLDSTGNGSISDAIQCIDYARRKGARVINASWGGPDFSSSLRSAIDSARQAGIVFVAAAGNEATDNDLTPTYPSGYDLDNIVSVAALTRTDALADYSNFGATKVDIAAPGSAIYSTWNSADSAYLYLSGTSMATPHVTGVFALMRARFPGETYRQIIDRVLAAAEPVPALAGKCLTGGRVSLRNALGPSLLADFTATPIAGVAPLTVNLTNTSFGAIANQVWNFGDNSPESTEPNPRHVYGAEGNFTVTLTVTGVNGANSSKSRVISVIGNYQIKTNAFRWIDPTGMTRLALSGDGVSSAQDLPFTFNFYGQSYQQIYVAANGMIGLVNQGLQASQNADLPNASLPNGMICPYWDNLNPAAGGAIYIGTIGTAPDRRTVISWVDVPSGSAGAGSTKFTFQALLDEGTHQIAFQYLKVQSGKSSLISGRSATIGVENQPGLIAAKYSYNGSTLLANNLALLFVPSSSAGMTVTPGMGLTVSGSAGGPFAPTSQSYTIGNSSAAALNWTVSHRENWDSLSATNGTLAAGQRTNITVTITPQADQLPAGSYLDTLFFINANNGIGNTTRAITLAVNGTTGILDVTPDAGLSASGFAGGPFAPVSQVYTLVNTGDATLNWTATRNETWTSLSASSGVLAAGESVTVTVAINADANELPAGAYRDTVSFTNATNGRGNTARALSLTVNQAAGVLLVLPDSVLNSVGFEGGPFTPVSQVFTLTNIGTADFAWAVSKSQDWLALSSTGGRLAAGESTNVIIEINSSAQGLAAGTYSGLITFTNVTDGTETFRDATLVIYPLPRLAVISSLPGGEFKIRLTAEPNQTYVFEVSTDLIIWTPVFTDRTSFEGFLDFSETQPAAVNRYYRAARAP